MRLRVRSVTYLAEAINGHKPGDTVTLAVLRNQQQVSIPVTLGELPAQ